MISAMQDCKPTLPNKTASMKTDKVMIIEDEADILEVIRYNLSREGYNVLCSRDGDEGYRMVKAEVPDLLVLDLMLPGQDGIEICRLLKQDPATRSMPIIMVTAKGEESDIVLGLGVGADDYLTKPFSPKELLARIRAVLRRGQLKESQGEARRIETNGVVIDVDRHDVTVDGVKVAFTATELRLLHFLASHPGRVFARDHLLSRVVGDNVYLIDRNIDVHVRAIRKKLGHRRNLIETVRGVGYRFSDVGR